ncbi:MAG: transporter substrate-binding protein [Acidimicrobiales bacterium]|nr:transporter substrate-binding protein [Acidimicrobiales bacterium]
MPPPYGPQHLHQNNEEPTLTNSLDRRTFLTRGAMAGAGLTLLGGGSGLLAACGKSSKSASTTTAAGGKTPVDLGTLDYQLSWIKNVEFAGMYIADKSGYYTAAGFSGVNLMSGGPNVQQDSVVAAGKALMGISAPDITGAAIVKGAPIIVIGALFQKNPFAIMSLASNPIKTPQDMIGKKIGVQATNEPVWAAFLKANKIDPSKVNKVPAQFDPQPLANKEVDGWFSFITNEPNLLKVKGIDTVSFLLNDFNYPLVSQNIVVRKDSLTNDKAKLKAALMADIKGWHDSLKDPQKGADLAANDYGKALKLDAKEQALESAAQNKLILTTDTMANGIMTVTPALIDENIRTLGIAGLKITAAQLFDMSLINEIYSENPALKTV